MATELSYASPPPAVAASVPNEHHMITLPHYTIEAPDVLKIDNVRLVPKESYRIQKGDAISVEIEAHTADGGPRCSSGGIVNSSGQLDLGPVFGKVKVSGMTEEEASQAMLDVLRKNIPDVKISAKLLSTSVRPVAGEYLVSPDGTVNLRTYGQVHVAGMTLEAATAAFNEQLGKFLDNPQASVEVFAYNSKVYYVITEGGANGDMVARVPITGNETVLDAISQVGGLTRLSSKNIWIARPTPGGSGCDVVLPVNWRRSPRAHVTTTNYQVLPGDRIFVSNRMSRQAAQKY